MKSIFVAGTDTDVGKTYITAGLAVALRKMNVDVGVMKPFAAGTAQKKGFKSEDVEILAKAAQVADPENLINPQFFPIPASPYTAWKNLKTKPKVSTILSSFKKLSKLHEMILVEGMGGIMTPILKDYYITNLIKEMKIPSVIVTRSKVGTVNHTIMTIQMCQKYKIPIKGIIINDFDDDGYPIKNLKRDLESLTGVKVLGSIPFIKDMSNASLNRIFKKNIDLKSLLK
ncbi:dethiobiotin synthase [Nitrosopumilus maritimus]|uniref:ATP-dependent dethiobiotin synthetase BioD n=1 Tax=Nitrosopumilus maritimus (strain SCM1) TaxID=436308 RepID=BIOD_NITMS|nr:dethiobiotin synthase [Nitrosopumilus maritimus]A9A5K8.1 RecName: Full=ATP-dependent dethiobiotin synthetase BioD; AltName: Full=DTB synthetase; Short=DTBS; AltName: Full=Dethiobiotin synthase [Nitrosopumilus maritimus SCM1]ABX12719.1 dethiobiotin synthase [Nitrosopumilus maritimus SCM1]